MRIIVPLSVTEAAYVSGNLAEDQYSVWGSGSNYTRGDYVTVLATHSIYQCLRDHNSTNANSPTTEAVALADPLTQDPDPIHWVYVSATNKWRLFDDRPSQKAARADEISAGIVLSERISAVAATELEGCSAATVKVTNGATTCKLEWTKPDDGGATIMCFDYRQRIAGDSWGSWITIRNSDENTTSFTVTGLNPENRYEFQVRSVNSDGNSPSSNTSSMTIESTTLVQGNL